VLGATTATTAEQQQQQETVSVLVCAEVADLLLQLLQ
jgi:hypothetical protein